MLRKTILALAAVAALTAPAIAQPAEVKALIQAFDIANKKCRDSGPEAVVLAACDRRETISEAISKSNWCYGKRDQAGYQYRWHRCTRGSIRYFEE